MRRTERKDLIEFIEEKSLLVENETIHSRSHSLLRISSNEKHERSSLVPKNKENRFPDDDRLGVIDRLGKGKVTCFDGDALYFK